MFAQLICKNDTRSLQAADSFSWHCAYLKTLFFYHCGTCWNEVSGIEFAKRWFLFH